MTDLNIRDVESETYKAVKVASAEAGVSLKAWLLGAISEKLGRMGQEVAKNRPEAKPEPVRAIPVERPKRVEKTEPVESGRSDSQKRSAVAFRNVYNHDPSDAELKTFMDKGW